MLFALTAVVAPIPAAAPRVAAGEPALPEFEEDLVFSGLASPTAVAFAPDGRIFVAEKRGTIRVFDSLADTSGAIWADLRTQVHNYWDRGLLGLAIDPDFPDPARIYVSYTHDAAIGGTAPRWGAADTDSDPCPSPPGGTAYGCVVSSRVSALTEVEGGLASEQVLVEDWCQQYPSHSIGTVVVGPDGALYVGHGDGASFNWSDYGQLNPNQQPNPDWPNNPCGDPPGGIGGAMTLPTAEGGALRAQDLRTSGDPFGLDGTIIRIDRFTGAGLAGNPLIGSTDLNERRVIAHGLRNPFRIAFRPGTSELWVGDVGQATAEEVDRIVDVTPASVYNFGWPCREGTGNGPTTFQSANLCLTLGATDAPYWSYPRAGTTGGCPTGSTASIAGLAFGTDDSFPAAYDGALFIADYSRDCIWAMTAGLDGLPDVASLHLFAEASNPVMLQIGPEGDLYYVDYAGAIRRIRPAGPNADISVDTTSGALPLQVQFDGSASSVVVGPIAYAWDLDGDGALDDSTEVAPSWTYTQAGEVSVRLRVTDGNDRTDTHTLAIHPGNLPPVPLIETPSGDLTWAVGDQVSFSGSASDPDEGALAADRLHWSLVMLHCPGACHEHEIEAWDGVAGASFEAPDHEYPSHLELRLTAVDQYGAAATASLALQPKTALVTVQSDPAGLQLGVGDTVVATPHVATAIVGSTISLSAPASQLNGGRLYGFTSWSDGGAAAHDIVVPLGGLTVVADMAVQFGDIGASPFQAEIAWAAAEGITTGCRAGAFCPLELVTREQMAAFLVRAFGLKDGSSPDAFEDIAGSLFRSEINRLAFAGVTTGCDAANYCPLQPVTREQMASFLVRALELSEGASPDLFSDIAASIHRFDINALAFAGVTTGCGGGLYCPVDGVTREQMVAFLYRALR